MRIKKVGVAIYAAEWVQHAVVLGMIAAAAAAVFIAFPLH